MPWLIDGDNLLGTWKRPRTDHERRRMAHQLRRWAAHERRRTVLVFDGPDPRFGVGGDVRFAGPGRSADDLILATLEAERDRTGWIVVTNDRSLGDRCRWLGSRVERCSEFRRRLAGDADSAEKPDRETEIDYWLERFGARDETGND